MYIFGTVLISVGSASASGEEVDALLQGAWREKRIWPKRLFLSNADPRMNSFAAAAERNGVSVEFVPKSVLAFYTNDVQAGFSEHFGL